jgi:PhnB protein
MSFAPYLQFAGDARAAMTFYAGVFQATDLDIMGFDAAPAGQRPPGDASRVMHSQFTKGPGAPLMAADMPEGMPVGRGGASVFHAADSVAEGARVFALLADGGQVHLPYAPTFWSPAFGGCTDQFGVSWMITVAPGAT